MAWLIILRARLEQPGGLTKWLHDIVPDYLLLAPKLRLLVSAQQFLPC